MSTNRTAMKLVTAQPVRPAEVVDFIEHLALLRLQPRELGLLIPQ